MLPILSRIYSLFMAYCLFSFSITLYTQSPWPIDERVSKLDNFFSCFCISCTVSLPEYLFSPAVVFGVMLIVFGCWFFVCILCWMMSSTWWMNCAVVRWLAWCEDASMLESCELTTLSCCSRCLAQLIRCCSSCMCCYSWGMSVCCCCCGRVVSVSGYSCGVYCSQSDACVFTLLVCSILTNTIINNIPTYTPLQISHTKYRFYESLILVSTHLIVLRSSMRGRVSPIYK